MTDSMAFNSFSGFGYAKALIFGEYAIMYGAPGLVAALTPKAKVTLRNVVANHSNILPPPAGPVSFEEQFRRILQNPSFHNDPDLGLKADFELDLSQFVDHDHQKIGIGSSAATIVAILQAKCQIRKSFHLPDVPVKEFIQTAIRYHRHCQNQMGSGFDIIASTLGGLLSVSHCPDEPEVQEISTDALPPFAILATHQQAPTLSFISAAHKHENTRDYQKIIDALKEIYTNLQSSVIQCNKSDFLCVLPEVSHWLGLLAAIIQMPILPEAFKSLSPVARSHDVILKTSGAGGGDIFLAFAKNSQNIQEFISNIPENSNVSVLPFNIASHRFGMNDLIQ